MNHLEPHELVANSIIVIEPHKGKPFYFFVNKCTNSVVPNEDGVVFIYGRSTEDLIEHCEFIEILGEKDLTFFKVPPLKSKRSNSFVKTFRRLSSQEKFHLLKRVDGFEKSQSKMTQKIHECFYRALASPKFVENLYQKKGQSVQSSL